MEFDSSDSGGVNLERFFFSMREALVVESLEIALVAENCRCWLLLAIGSLPNDFFAEVWQNDERLPINGAREPDIEYDDAGKTEDDTVTEQRDYDDQNDADMSEEEGSYDGDEDSENNDDSGDSNGERGSSDGDEGDDDDKNNEYSEDEYDEEDGEEYEEDEEDEEEQDIPYRHSKKHKSVDGHSDDTTGSEYDTTGSEYDDDTDDDPGFGSLLRHAREVYAVTSFHLFEREYKKKHALDLDLISDERLVFEYSIRKSGQHFREYKVTAEPLDDLINCSCKYFDLVGILCCHALMVLGCLRIEKIPEPYILKWRRKNGTGGTGEETLSLTDNYKGHGSSSDFIHHRRRLMDTVIFHLVRSKDDLDMLNVGDHLLRRPRDMPVDRRLLRRGFFSYMRNGTMSQEENKRLEHLSIDPVHMEFDSEESEHMHSRYHVHAPLLRHARDVYLPNIYPMFREEHRKSEYLDVYTKNDTFNVRGLVFDFEVLEPGYHKFYKVHAEPDDGSVYCSCKGFEKKGILCRHALSVMDRLFIEKVPAKYILGKFMKNQGVGVAEEIHGEKYPELRHFIRWKTLRTKLDKLAQIAATSDAASAIFVEDMEKIQVMLACSSDERDKAMKKATGKNRGQNRMQSNAEELETKRVNQSAHLSMEAIDQNKIG